MSKFSVIIPVYNRPDEVVELLESLTRQTAKCDVEVVIVEDGSKKRCENEVAAFADTIKARGNADYRIRVTSLLRTDYSVNKLQKRNRAATSL